jgi:hypothetical protein
VRRLSDGAIALFSGEAAGHQVRTLLDEDVIVDVAKDRLAALVELAHGVADGAGDAELFAELEAAGLAADGLADDDAVVLGRLRELGAGLSWRPGNDDDDLTDFVRRVHARRKGSYLDFWQGPCVPECAAARVRAAQRVLEPGARIFLVGDDDLLSLALAHVGFAVTCIDIDEALIHTIRALAAQERLDVDARVLDLCRPLPEELRGAFDAAMTDPQSAPATMTAFVSRALAAVPDGAPLWVSVHDEFRRGFGAVRERLPARVVESRLSFSAYYTHGYVADPYRSDFLRLERTSGPLPFAADEEIDAATFMEGHAGGPHHAIASAKVMTFSRGAWLDPAELRQGLDAKERFALRGVEMGDDGKAGWLFAAPARGGHLALRFDWPKRQLAYAFTPVEEDDESILDRVLRDFVQPVRQEELCAPAPHGASLVYR